MNRHGNRHGNRWNVNEVLSLQREYELLEWTVQQIADKHKRSVMSIVYKLHAEGFTDFLLEARGYNEKPFKDIVSSPIKVATSYFSYCDEDVDEDPEPDNDTSSDFEDDVLLSDFEDDYQDDDDDEDCLDNEDEYEKTENKVLFKQSDEVSEDVSEVDKLTERVWSLETSVGEIGTMVKSLFDKLVVKNTSKKLQPLRKISI